MDNEPQSDQPVPTRDWTSYHEHTNQQVDVGAMAALVRRVGGELSKIDSQSVSNSTQRAERIDKQKLIRDLAPGQPPSAKPQSVPIPAQAPPPIVHQSVSLPPDAQTLPPPVAANPNTPQAQSPQLDDLEKRITRLESATRTFRKAKKIKRGTSYKVSSNSMKGVIKDSSLVAEFVISELAKGVKSITIKLDESTDT